MKRSTALNLKRLVRLIPINHKLYFSRSSRDKTFRHCLSDISTCPNSTFLLPEWSRSHWSQTVLSPWSRHFREKVTGQSVKNFTAHYKTPKVHYRVHKKPHSYQRICVIYRRCKRIFRNLSFYLRQLHGVQLKIESMRLTTSNGLTFPRTRVTCGDRGSTVVKVLCYKSEGRWFDSRWCHWNFSLT